MKKINYLELGGTLFIPATHKSLEDIVNVLKYPALKSILVDTEDGLREGSLSKGLENIQIMLRSYDKKRLLVFIRPKNISVLKELLSFDGIEKIDGFILPKFSLSNGQEYFDVLKPYDFSLMPSVEGEELFNQAKLQELKEIILTNADNVVLVRFGLEDVFRQLSLKRGSGDTAFDLSSTMVVLGNFIATFKSEGFAISGGVYPDFSDKEGFVKDVKRDLKEGLFSKTIIHPSQIEPCNELYKVSQIELDESLKICESLEAAFNLNGKMAESITMTPYAKEIIQRAKIYGVTSPKEEQSLL